MTFYIAFSTFSLVFVLWIGAHTRRLDRETIRIYESIERDRKRDQKSSTPTGSDDRPR